MLRRTSQVDAFAFKLQAGAAGSGWYANICKLQWSGRTGTGAVQFKCSMFVAFTAAAAVVIRCSC